MNWKAYFILFFLIVSANCEREPLLPGLKPKEQFDKTFTKPNEDDLIFVNRPAPEPEKKEVKEELEDKIEKNTEGKVDATELNSQENILKAFGDPADDLPVMAQESAPKPYKAMLAALNIGNKELAFEYAKQYVRYNKDVISTVTEAVKAQGYAKYAEGELTNTEKLLTEEPDADYLAMVKKDLEAKKKDTSKIISIDQEANELIKSVEVKKEDQPEAVDEAKERLQARKNLTAFLQPKKANKVDMIYFFKPGQEESQKMAREIEKVKKSYGGKLNVVGMTIENYDKLTLADFKEINGLSYELGVGSKLAGDLKIVGTPTLLFMTDARQSYVEQGVRSEFYIDEIIQSFRGNE